MLKYKYIFIIFDLWRQGVISNTNNNKQVINKLNNQEV